MAILASPSGRLNSDANAMPDSNADACVEMNKWAVAKYNIQLPNTNAMLHANAMPDAEAVPLVNALADTLPMGGLNAQIYPYFCLIQHTNAQYQYCGCAHGQSQYTNSFILLPNTIYKCPIPMPCPLPFPWLCLLPFPSHCQGCALGQCFAHGQSQYTNSFILNTQYQCCAHC